MKLGILASIFGGFGVKGYYNAQEIGLGRALAEAGHQVTVYKLVDLKNEPPKDTAEGNLSVRYIPARNLGIHGLVDPSVLDPGLDALIFFADTQLSVPAVDRWCRRTGVTLLPYIGVTESHSGSGWKRKLMDSLFGRNLKVFRRRSCLAKNPDIVRRLQGMGVKQVTFAPVGVDLELLNADYASADPVSLKEKYGFAADRHVLLYIGRLEDEKRPLALISMFDALYKQDSSYELLIVGRGYLYQAMMEEIAKRGLGEAVHYIERLPNKEIWQLYRMADAFVNMNDREIFGMVLLESMYYECRVVAFHAPGPDYIIENHVSGELVSSEEEMVRRLLTPTPEQGPAGHRRVLEKLTWRTTAEIMANAAARELSAKKS